MKIVVISVVLGTVPKGLGKGTGGIENQWKYRDHLDNSLVEICQNTENSSGNLRIGAIT